MMMESEPEKDDDEKDQDFTSWSAKQVNKESKVYKKRGPKPGSRRGVSRSSRRSTRTREKPAAEENRPEFVNSDLLNGGAVPYGYDF